jgi:hypothetical protein
MKVKTFDTPADPNQIDSNGRPREHDWEYRAVIGCLTYLQGMTRPNLSSSVHQGARFCNDPKLSHERAVKRICWYLYGTRDKGLILEPDLSKGFECHVDAD